MSGYIDDSILPSRVLEPTFHFIQKPFTADRLCRQIEVVLGALPERAPETPNQTDIEPVRSRAFGSAP